MKEDEKIANHIAGILNVMADLAKLASEYQLENDLYYGVGLHKIMEFLGKHRQRKFIKSIAGEEIGGKDKWSRLVEHLRSELKEREAYVLHEKVTQSASVESKDTGKDSGKAPSKAKDQGKDSYVSSADISKT